MAKQAIKQKELMILLSSLLAFAILLTLTTLYYRSDPEKPEEEKEEPVTVEGALDQGEAMVESVPEKKEEIIGSQVFFVTPTAAELLQEIRTADPYGEQPNFSELPPVKVMWSGFYFSDQEIQGNDKETTILLDVDESGFGALLSCTINNADYPEIKTLDEGQQLWVAGQITEIDPEGTGTIHIQVEYVRFDEGPEVKRTAP